MQKKNIAFNVNVPHLHH